jgi:hypothetical protein
MENVNLWRIRGTLIAVAGLLHLPNGVFMTLNYFHRKVEMNVNLGINQ